MNECVICQDLATDRRKDLKVCEKHSIEPASDMDFIAHYVAQRARDFVKASQGAQINRPNGDPSECWDNLVLAVGKME